MNAEMLSMMKDVIDSHDCDALNEIEMEACANDEICKEAYAVWKYSCEVSRESEKVVNLVTGKLIEAMRNKLGLLRTENLIHHLLNTENLDACKTEIELFEAVYNLSDSVGCLADHSCNLLNPIFENSPAYHNAVKSRYDRLMENSDKKLSS